MSSKIEGIPPKDEKILNAVYTLLNSSKKERTEIYNAYLYAHNAHKNQKRKSGEDYIIHCLRVAHILAELKMPKEVIIAGILHDTLEDTETTYQDLEKMFSKEIAFLANGVSLLGPIKYKGFEKSKRGLQKLFMFSAQDIRALFIKLADRLDNMRTLESITKEKQIKIATETQIIYSPIAKRLGIGKIYLELDDLCLKYIKPEQYATLKKKIDDVADSKKTKECTRAIEKVLLSAGMQKVILQNRIKSISSIDKKIKEKQKDFEDIHDIIGIRILTDTLPECYTALGILHQNYETRKDMLKDYIANPKTNGYRSIHTQIFFNTLPIDVQIRTNAMHEHAEHGIAAHFLYKKGDIWLEKKFPELQDKTKNWIQQISDIDVNKTTQKYLAELREEYLSMRMFIYTEKRDVVDIPKEATALDFAYIIHPHIGKKAIGAWVNDKYTKLDTPLTHGDTVKIKTGKTKTIHEKHLRYVKTKEAKLKIKKLLRSVSP